MIGSPAPTVASYFTCRLSCPRHGHQRRIAVPRPGERLLVGEDHVEPVAERGAQQIAGLFARDVDDDRPRDGVARHHAQRLGGFRRPSAELGEQLAGVFLARQLRQAAARNALRIEDVAGAIEQADDSNLALTVGRADLIRQRSPDAPEAQEHDVGARRGGSPSAANLRQLERGVDAPCRFGGLIGS